MAAGKKSFVLYSDQKELFESLPDEQAGKLIKHIFKYVNDENPISEDALVNLAFISVKASLKRDLQKWEKQVEQRSAAGKASAEKRKQSLTESNEKQRPLEVVNETQRNPTDSVSDSVSVNVNDTDINNIPQTPKGDSYLYDNFEPNLERLLNQINYAFGKKYQKISDKVKAKYKVLLKSHKWVDIKNAINAVKDDKFHIDSNYKYATPEFFSRPDKIDMYGFKSEIEKKYTGENALLVNNMDKYLKSGQS
jgi:hypothetical protein